MTFREVLIISERVTKRARLNDGISGGLVLHPLSEKFTIILTIFLLLVV